MFPNALSRFVEAVNADGADGGEAIGWAEAAGGNVALIAFEGLGQSLWMGIGCGVGGRAVPCIGLARSLRLGGGLAPWMCEVKSVGRMLARDTR